MKYILIHEKVVVKQAKKCCLTQKFGWVNMFELKVFFCFFNMATSSLFSKSNSWKFSIAGEKLQLITSEVMLEVNQFVLIDLLDLNSCGIQWGTAVDSWKAVAVVYSALKCKSPISMSSDGQCRCQNSKSRLIKPEIHNEYPLYMLLNWTYPDHQFYWSETGTYFSPFDIKKNKPWVSFVYISRTPKVTLESYNSSLLGK